MTGVLSNAGRAALRAFAAATIPLALGFLSAPNLNDYRLLAAAVMVAGFDAALKAFQVFVPRLTTGNPTVDAFLRAGVSAFIAFAPGIYTAPDLGGARAGLTALIVGSAAALLRIGQGLLTKSETATGAPAPAAAGSGFEKPDR